MPTYQENWQKLLAPNRINLICACREINPNRSPFHYHYGHIICSLLSVVVHAANVHNTKTGIFAAAFTFRDYPAIRGFCADARYRDTFEQEVREKFNLPVDI